MAKPRTIIEEFQPDPRLVDERGATVHRLRKSDGLHESGSTGTTTMRDCPLERALRKPLRGAKDKTLIDHDQYNAGIKFRHHWFHAGFAPSIGSADLNRVFSRAKSGAGASERQIFHRQQYQAACRHVGMRTEKILADVICWELPLDEIGHAQLGMNSRQSAEVAVKALFSNGLFMLVDLWGMRTK